MYEFYDETQPQYLKTDASGIRLSCHTTNQKQYKLPKRQSTRQQHTYTHHNSKQEPVKYRNKIEQHWKRGTMFTTWSQKAPSLLLCERGEYNNNRSQTTSSNLYKRCSNAISENTTKPQGKRRQRNTWHAVDFWHHTDNYKHPRLHDDTAITTGNLTRWSPTSAQRWYHQRLAREQRSNTTRHVIILDILRWYSSDLWGYTQRQTCSNTGVITKQALEQLNLNHMVIKKLNSWPTNQFIGQISMMILKSTLKITSCLDFQKTQPKENIIHHELPAKPWEIVGTDMFILHNRNYLYVL